MDPDLCFDFYSYLRTWLSKFPNLFHTTLGWGHGLQEAVTGEAWCSHEASAHRQINVRGTQTQGPSLF